MTTGRTDHPLWRDTPRTAPTPQLVPLSGDVTCDVAVVGAGLVGLTTALELARAGRSVVVLEARHVGAGTTGGSSAKVTLQQGTHLSSLAARHEPATVRLYVQACATGQQYVRDLCEATGATHDVLAAVTYATSPSGRAALADEAGVMAAAGIPGELLSSADLPFGTTGALRLADQLQVDPQAYLEVLVAQALAAGARVHVGTRVDRVGTGTPRELTCSTAQGRARVRAGHVVVATGSPVLDRGGFFARLEPQRSYCIAVRVPGERPAGMYLSADSPTRSIRPAGEDRVVVGGNGHPVGRAQDNAARVADLERWAAEHLGATEVTHRWAAQDYRTTDGLPFVGRLEPWSHDLWVATGFAKWGMTAGTAAALALAGALTERPAAWAASWDPWRGDAATQVPDTATFNAHVVQEGATGWFGALRDVAPDPAQVPEGGGVVGRAGLRPVGVSRVDGTVRTVSAVCPHLGGVLRWNDAEMSWDCPLHGSRFAADGARLEGPARCGLARLDTR
ncbi:FAD-dependent oxidoreductase [Actinotalea subterranea]|uniref:FAD-dependent oxidoreductase n=1 Tax=Actinotalea subterranea TaxID=2607497 RepID=UPI0011EF20F3|nr:FAD-dependent oxidoreductase [Actinotalea subterranea]